MGVKQIIVITQPANCRRQRDIFAAFRVFWKLLYESRRKPGNNQVFLNRRYLSTYNCLFVECK